MDDLISKLNVLMRARLRTLVSGPPQPRRPRSTTPPAPMAQETTPSSETTAEAIDRTVDRLREATAARTDTAVADEDMAKRIDRLSRK